jgi:hypothetical protein
MDHEDFSDLATVGYTGELKDFDPHMDVDFANMDLMCNANGRPGEVIGLTTQWLRPGSVATVTYLRARETGDVREDLKKIQKRVPLTTMFDSRKHRRLLGADPGRSLYILYNMVEGMYGAIIKRLGSKGLERKGVSIDDDEAVREAAWDFAHYVDQVGGPAIFPVASFNYQAAVSPMAVFMAQIVSPQQRTRAWKKKLERKSSSLHRRKALRLVTSTIPKDAMTELLEEVDELAQRGFTSQQVADIFDVSVGTMAAWKAHRTMGSYG